MLAAAMSSRTCRTRRRRRWGRCSRRRRARCGSRSASAAASICSGRRAQHPDVGMIGCEPFQDGVVKVLRAIEEQRARQYPAACRRCPPAPALAARGQHRAGLHPVPRSLAEEAPPEAPAAYRRPRCAELARVMRAGRGAAHCHRYRRLCPLDAAGGARGRAVSLERRRRRATGGSGRPIGRRPAMSRRPSARAAAVPTSAFAGDSPAVAVR